MSGRGLSVKSIPFVNQTVDSIKSEVHCIALSSIDHKVFTS